MHAVPHDYRRRRQAGFSLIEVMVAVLVLSVGLLGLARLQLELVRGAADARARNAAVALAEEKLEDFRSYAVVDGACPQAWSCIQGDGASGGVLEQGGRIPSQDTYSSALELEGVRYTRTWEVDDVVYTSSVGPALGLPTDYKDVTVYIAWSTTVAGPTNTGSLKQVQLTGSIMGIPPGNVIAASEPVSERPSGPEVLYTPGEAPEIISVPIDVGGGRRRETTKPLPTVQAQADFSHEVTFDVVNYHSNGTENIVDRREEFVTVNCRCKIGPSGPARTPARVSFVGGVLRDQPGQVVTKQTGVVNETGPTGFSQQPALCTLCCRDHFDGTLADASPARYNPTAGTNHSHYLVNFSPTPPTFTGPVTSTNAPYDEACRLKRVNGVFQVYEDWNLENMVAMPIEDLGDGTTTQADYVQYIQDFVRHAVAPSTPAATLPTFSATALGAGGSRQLLGRAIYLDRMPQALLDFLTDPDGPIANDEPFLEFVPFFEINLTKLAHWKLQLPASDADEPTLSGQACNPTTTQAALAGEIACIASQAVVTEALQQENYYRGLIVAGPVGGARDARVYARDSNTSITSTFPLSLAELNATPIAAEHAFSVTAAAAVTGSIEKAANNNPNGNPWGSVTCAYTISTGGSGTCDLLGSGSNSPRSFSISAPTGATVTVTISYSGNECPATQTATAPGSLPVPFIIRTNTCP